MDQDLSSRIGALPEGARQLLACLAALEPPERRRSIAERLWEMTMAALGRAGKSAPFEPALAQLKDARLLAENPLGFEISEHTGESGATDYLFAVEAEVERAARAETPAEVAQAARKSASQFWLAMITAIGRSRDVEDKPAALARSVGYAMPYLLTTGSREDWFVFIEEALAAGDQPEVWEALLPLFRRMAETPENEATAAEAMGRYVQALAAAGRANEAGRALPDALERARAAGRRRAEAALLSVQATLERQGGRFDAALALLRQALAIAYALGDKRHCCQLHLELAACIDIAGRFGQSVNNRLAAGVIALVCGFDALNAIARLIGEDLALDSKAVMAGFDTAPASLSYAELARAIHAAEGVELAALLEDDVAAREPKEDLVAALLHEAEDAAREAAATASGKQSDPLGEALDQLEAKSPKAGAEFRRALERCVRAGVEAGRVMPVLSGLPAAVVAADPAPALRAMSARLDGLIGETND